MFRPSARSLLAARVFTPRAAFPDYHIPLSNFQGHQRKAMLRIEQLAPQLNLLLEVRDSTAPLSTHNVLFDQLVATHHLDRIILYTKRDVCAPQTPAALHRWHAETGDDFMLLDARSAGDAASLLAALRARYDAAAAAPGALPLGFRLLVAGMPNVGKSTLVNRLRASGTARRAKVAATGAHPGVTRATSECVRIADHRAGIYMHDTPGVALPARASSVRRMLALALAGCVGPAVVDPVIQADYLLYLLNLQGHAAAYADYCPPTNDIAALLAAVRARHRMRSETAAALHWLAVRPPGLCLDPELLLPPDAFSYKHHVTAAARVSLLPPRHHARAGRSAARARNSNVLFR
ncbi:AaceriABL048Wp [[Ashbya] aceris (nom. inval.)]|nr:AaceriABL048Wp [[Ashbya] aceris (nom. inval.)]